MTFTRSGTCFSLSISVVLTCCNDSCVGPLTTTAKLVLLKPPLLLPVLTV